MGDETSDRQAVLDKLFINFDQLLNSAICSAERQLLQILATKPTLFSGRTYSRKSQATAVRTIILLSAPLILCFLQNSPGY